jgi:pimeloyl-ACP methyl ester carboxylesterase
MNQLNKINIPLTIENVKLNISTLFRQAKEATIVFLHGFGSTKEDYADIIQYSELNNYSFLAYDAPGCGETTCDSLTHISIAFLVDTARAMLKHFSIQHFHLIGHSMGGLTSLILADQNPKRVLSFANIEGNISPEDCFLSRQIIDYPVDDAQVFFDHFIQRTRLSLSYSVSMYASRLPYTVRAIAVPSIFKSMVELSDHGDLMDKFLNLLCPTLFMYGDQNQSLSYLNTIKKKEVLLKEVPQCGHFPMYSNPIFMWKTLIHFIQISEQKGFKKH